jgi:DNA polymerase
MEAAMPDDPRLGRKVRQMLRTDVLLGADRVPLGSAESLEPQAPTEPEQSRPQTRAQASGDKPEPSASTRSEAAPVGPPPPATLADATPTKADDPMPGRNMTTDQKADALQALEQELTSWVEANWPRDGWQRVVFGEGDPDARLLFIGEGPGAEEDAQGRPFVGRAGQLLDKQINAMQLDREQVYIANIAKVRPPGNRVPTPEEAEKWLPWLDRQIEIIVPEVIVTLGATSAKYLLEEPKFAITKQRGTWRTYRGIDLLPTFHPAYLLRQYSVENRRRVWSDLQSVMNKLGLSGEGK